MLVVTSLSMNSHVPPLKNLKILFRINELDPNVQISLNQFKRSFFMRHISIIIFSHTYNIIMHEYTKRNKIFIKLNGRRVTKIYCILISYLVRSWKKNSSNIRYIRNAFFKLICYLYQEKILSSTKWVCKVY